MEDSSNVEAAAAAPAAEVHLVEEEDEQQLVPKENASSIMWQHFGFKREDTAQKDVKCKLCKKTVVTSQGFFFSARGGGSHSDRYNISLWC